MKQLKQNKTTIVSLYFVLIDKIKYAFLSKIQNRISEKTRRKIYSFHAKNLSNCSMYFTQIFVYNEYQRNANYCLSHLWNILPLTN